MTSIVQAGVVCPSCSEEVYSSEEDKHEPTHCPCEATYVKGGTEYLAYKTSAPFDLSDVVVVQRTVFEEEEAADEEEVEYEEVYVEEEELDAELGNYVQDGNEVEEEEPVQDGLGEEL